MLADLSQFERILIILNVLLAFLSVVFLFGFFLQWRLGKYRLSVIAFYTKKRFVKHNLVLGTGIIALSLAYIVEFIWINSKSGDPAGQVIVRFLQTIALICIGYSYYKLVRLQIPT